MTESNTRLRYSTQARDSEPRSPGTRKVPVFNALLAAALLHLGHDAKLVPTRNPRPKSPELCWLFEGAEAHQDLLALIRLARALGAEREAATLAPSAGETTANLNQVDRERKR